MLTAQTAFKYAALIYLLATTFSYLTSSKKILAGIIFSGLSLNCVALFLRYNQAWPMLPMYLSPIVSSFCLATLLLILILFNRDKSSFRTIKYGLLFLTVATILTTTFPKDFYLPFSNQNHSWPTDLCCWAPLAKAVSSFAPLMR